MGIDAKRSLAIAFAAAFVSQSAGAQTAGSEPLSAIDWLSDSVELPESSTPPETVAPATIPPEIKVLPLGMPVPDRAGLIDARNVGLSPRLWGRSAASDLARAVTTLPDGTGGPPSLRRFLHDLMVLRLDPPIDAAIDDSLYLARIDRLLAMGHLDAAQSLLDGAGAPEPRRFRRAFDIALLTDAEEKACRTIEGTPDISPTYVARIFCLARLGQWEVAALTLGNAEALGILTPEEDQLLLHFLDPELFEDQTLPAAPRLPSPLMFRLYEAVGERIPTEHLPVAFAAADLGETVGWKARLRAAERLSASDAMAYVSLIRVYSERKPSASGGIWERVAAHQALLAAMDAGDPDEIARTLPDAWTAAREAGFHAGFADWLAPRISGVTLNGTAGHLAFEIALLAGRPAVAEEFAAKTREDRFLLAVARNQAGGAPAGPDPLERAVLRGLSSISPGSAYQALIEDDRQGEALIRAMAQLMEGAAGNPDATANSLALLRTLGLDGLAVRVAVELVLMEGAA